MNAYTRFAAVIRLVSKLVSVVAMVVAFVITFVLVIDIVLRLVTESVAVTGTYELTEMAMAVIVFLALAVTQVEGAHVRVTMIVDRLPGRAKAFANALTATFSTVISAIVLYAGLLQAIRNTTEGVTTAVLFIPLAPFTWIMALGLLLLTLAFLVDAADYWLRAIRGDPEVQEEELPGAA